MYMRAKGSASRAGTRGELLTPGRCAWSDRRWGGSGGPNIEFSGAVKPAEVAAPLSVCALTDDCVVGITLGGSEVDPNSSNLRLDSGSMTLMVSRGAF